MLGDINGDGSIDKADAVLALKYINGTQTLTAAQINAANTVGNLLKIDLRDVIAILNMSAE